jgi:hypothetical protein
MTGFVVHHKNKKASPSEMLVLCLSTYCYIEEDSHCRENLKSLFMYG